MGTMKLYWLAVLGDQKAGRDDEWTMISGPFGSLDEAFEAQGRVRDTVDDGATLYVVETFATVQAFYP